MEGYARKRIFNGCEVRIENSITRVTVLHHEDSCSRTVNPSDGIFNSHQTTIINSFFTHIIADLTRQEKLTKHDKTNKMSVRTATTQISLGILPVWSQSSLCTQWAAKDPSFLHADSKDLSDWADAQADLNLCWPHTHFVGFVMSWLKC